MRRQLKYKVVSQGPARINSINVVSEHDDVVLISIDSKTKRLNLSVGTGDNEITLYFFQTEYTPDSDGDTFTATVVELLEYQDWKPFCIDGGRYTYRIVLTKEYL